MLAENSFRQSSPRRKARRAGTARLKLNFAAIDPEDWFSRNFLCETRISSMRCHTKSASARLPLLQRPKMLPNGDDGQSLELSTSKKEGGETKLVDPFAGGSIFRWIGAAGWDCRSDEPNSSRSLTYMMITHVDRTLPMRLWSTKTHRSICEILNPRVSRRNSARVSRPYHIRPASVAP